MVNQKIKTYYEGLVEPIYRTVSGTVLHLGMFEGHESREVATIRTKEYLAARLPGALSPSNILDLGSGYGDAARYLAQRFGCRVVGINLIHSQNMRANTLNREAGLDRQIAIIEADFTHVPIPNDHFSIIWSQEAFLHAPNRSQVLQEAARMLQPGGTFIFTDILQIGPMEPEEARLIYERVKINSLETFDSYKAHLHTAGLHLEEVGDLSQYVALSYQDHIDQLEAARSDLVDAVGVEYIDYTIKAMGRWVTAAKEDKLGWGMFVARKP